MVQEYDKYTEEDQQVWRSLFERQMEVLEGRASRVYLESVERIGFTADAIPRFEEVNERLADTTGWQVQVVPGLIPQREFFELLSQKKFPSSTWLRSMEQLDYLQEPDMFHDLFGHVPLLSYQPFCDYFQEFGRIALDHLDHEEAVLKLGRLYWFTIEFGLIREREDLRLYGAGLCSSPGEAKYCLSDEPDHLAFDVRQIMNTSYDIDRFQDRYFVIEDYEQLYASTGVVKAELDRVISVGQE